MLSPCENADRLNEINNVKKTNSSSFNDEIPNFTVTSPLFPLLAAGFRDNDLMDLVLQSCL